MGQGFHFAKPMDPQALDEFLSQRARRDSPAARAHSAHAAS